MMKNLNTRRWSTPLTMGAGLFVVITGLLMFFVAERPFKFAHELIGIAFSAAVGLHVLSHWRSFSNYFSQRGAVREPDRLLLHSRGDDYQREECQANGGGGNRWVDLNTPLYFDLHAVGPHEAQRHRCSSVTDRSSLRLLIGRWQWG